MKIILFAQMMPGMQWIPLLVVLVGLALLMMITLVVKHCQHILPNRKFRIGVSLLILATFLLLCHFFLPIPVSENSVINNARRGMTVKELVSNIGEPHEKHLAPDGSGSLHYYADLIGHKGIGVVVNSDGTIGDTWVD